MSAPNLRKLPEGGCQARPPSKGPGVFLGEGEGGLLGGEGPGVSLGGGGGAGGLLGVRGGTRDAG